MNKPVAHTLTRPIRDDADVETLAALMRNRAKPCTVTIRDGLPRTGDQNSLQRLWCGEVAEQLGDRTAEQVRGVSKLQFGVPIMRRDHAEFAEKYDRLIKPHSYEEKVEMMMEPLDFPVTRLMTTRQKTEYLDAMHAFWVRQGVLLTIPEPKR